MTTEQYIADLERRLKNLEGNDALRDSETKATRKIAESAERQVRHLQEPFHALRSYLDRFHAPKEEKYSFFKAYDEVFATLALFGGLFALVSIFSIVVSWLK
jgi:hypothetical protein